MLLLPHATLSTPLKLMRQGVYLSDCDFPSYAMAYNLNNHPRGILAAHLLSAHVVGAGDQGPLKSNLPPWVEYLQKVARERGNNRIHIADAFCGLSGVKPPGWYQPFKLVLVGCRLILHR